MAKSSGTTRASSSGSPRGLAASPEAGFSTATESVDIRAIRNTGFQNMGGGMWELNTPRADASILLDEDSMGNAFYEIQTVGAEDVRTGVYTSDSPGRRFANLNAAKAAAREELEKYYRKVNS